MKNGVSIIIVNYNTYKLTKECISSVERFTNGLDYEIIVVDNMSPQRDIELIKNDFPEVIFVQNETNAGFAAANNLGISHSNYTHLLLLNSDVELIENSIKISYDYYTSDSKIGIVGVRLIYPDGKIQYAPRRFRTLRWELLDWFRPLVKILNEDKREELMLGRYSKNMRTLEVDMVPGAFFMISRAVVDQMEGGKLDETYFMYGEDYLWCWEVKNVLGYKVVFLAETEVIHHLSASTSPSKRIALTKTMAKNQMQTTERIYGKGLYYYTFAFFYLTKEYGRMWTKEIMNRLNIPIPR